MAWYDDPVIVVAVALVIIVAVTTAIYAMRRTGTKKPSKQEQPAPQPAQPAQPAPAPTPAPTPTPDPIALQYASLPLTNAPFKLSKSIPSSSAVNAKDELRMLDLEREILGDAIRRLYEAQAEGKITEAERDKLAASYKQRMNTIKESITKDEGIIALHELESMQEDLMKLFSERFGELTSKVEELRGRIDVKPIREIQVKPIPTQHIMMDDAEEEDEEEETSEVAEKKTAVTAAPRKPRKPAEEKPSQKTEAEKRIETIRSEVEKVLDKLGQMEIET
ncbi:hypothetical protein GX563_10600 [Candidatus Bathyarchaeota archaeon]|nr:hypothetical protein [Candidatus Bathyarchaeota archaeon]